MSTATHKANADEIEELAQMARKVATFVRLAAGSLEADFGLSQGILWNEFATGSFDHDQGQFGKELVIALNEIGIEDAEAVVRALRINHALNGYVDARGDELTDSQRGTVSELAERILNEADPFIERLLEHDLISDLLQGDEQNIDQHLSTRMIWVDLD